VPERTEVAAAARHIHAGNKEGVFYTIWEKGGHFVWPGMYREHEVILGRKILPLFAKGEEIELLQGKVGLVAECYVETIGSYRFCYQVDRGEFENGMKAALNMASGVVQDTLDSYLKENYDVETVLGLTGGDLGGVLLVNEEMTADLAEIGIQLRTLVIRDVKPSQIMEEERERTATLEQKRKQLEIDKELKELEIEIKGLEGKAEGERDKQHVAVIAEDLKGKDPHMGIAYDYLAMKASVKAMEKAGTRLLVDHGDGIAGTSIRAARYTMVQEAMLALEKPTEKADTQESAKITQAQEGIVSGITEDEDEQ
jgi:hypothetical protein